MLKKCESCGKFFGADDDRVTLCASCSEGEITGLKHIKDPKEQRFVVARNLVYENPDISPEALVKEMKEKGIDISIREIMGYVKEGRLTLKNANPDDMFCEDCGKRILSGRRCPTCTRKFEEHMHDARAEILKEVKELKDEEKKRKNIMHTQG